ncbi:MAG TPA: hypothetical protein VIM56_03845 [Rhizomicrobium sp.]
MTAKRHRLRNVGKRDMANAVAMVKALGLTAVAVEAQPGLVRILTAEGRALTAGGEIDELDEELREFRQQNGHG